MRLRGILVTKYISIFYIFCPYLHITKKRLIVASNLIVLCVAKVGNSWNQIMDELREWNLFGREQSEATVKALP